MNTRTENLIKVLEKSKEYLLSLDSNNKDIQEHIISIEVEIEKLKNVPI